MAGEIHGIISRDQAWEHWQPYGERAIGLLDSSLNIDSVTSPEVAAVAIGASQADLYELMGELEAAVDPKTLAAYPNWFAAVSDGLALGAPGNFLDIIDRSNKTQREQVAVARQRAIDNGEFFVARLSNALSLAADHGYVPEEAVATMQARLYADDGTPYFQVTHMTPLEATRLEQAQIGSIADPRMPDSLDYGLGIAQIIHRDYFSPGSEQHNPCHELVHGMAGAEIFDVTYDNGRRQPQSTAVGHFQAPPTTLPLAGYDLSHVETVELGEGWTDKLSRLLMAIDPALGRPIANDTYERYISVTEAVCRLSSDIAAAVLDAAIVDASPERPTAKQAALTSMNTLVDERLGITGALGRAFMEDIG